MDVMQLKDYCRSWLFSVAPCLVHKAHTLQWVLHHHVFSTHHICFEYMAEAVKPSLGGSSPAT